LVISNEYLSTKSFAAWYGDMAIYGEQLLKGGQRKIHHTTELVTFIKARN
jgi:hypothetical protein